MELDLCLRQWLRMRVDIFGFKLKVAMMLFVHFEHDRIQ